ncbi:hypothetical protein [Asticcacaulis machinosus]|uniref:Nucleotidyl transferase AbiEii toxin, Type IV TA system n=1 Tax=Asticcacaulis machinosus TaxID=2984211 RepID=A0ABT5HEM7_9CAUL|nr:hypothetical protein [Asticcacaulis machinosus]MDC7674707.1 hypothetical protein [Asticcacaulis machinosus]
MTQALLRTFDFLREVMPPEPSWRVIGSGALWLSGVPVVPQPEDVDVVAPFEVIEGVRRALKVSLPVASKPDERFRSRPFFQYRPDGGVIVDFMGDLDVFGVEWHRLRFESCVSAGGIFLPDLNEQVAILRRFGRPKDLQRIEAVQVFLSGDQADRLVADF